MLIGKNKRKIKKKALCLIFAFLLSINSFAAVVADNDGSAFITKAEFDSMKNSFQSQLDSYNSNIDNKIDNAIASYLAGIKVSKETTLNGNISCFSYPLKIVNYYKGLYNLDTPITEQATPFYSPGYRLYGGLHRAQSSENSGLGDGMLAISLLEIPYVNQEKTWLNGHWDGVAFVADGMSGGLGYYLSGAVYYDGDHDILQTPSSAWGESGEGGFIACDYKSVSTSEVGAIATGTTRSHTGYTLYSNYDVYTHTNQLLNINIICGIISAASSISWNYGTNNLDTWRFTPTGRTLWLNRCATENKLKSYTYSPNFIEKFDTVFNSGLYYDPTQGYYNVEEYKKYLAPVTFGSNHTIYLTNLKRYRQAVTQSTSNSAWWRMYDLQSDNRYTATGVITTGLNIESEYSTSPTTGTNAHPWNQRSAIMTKDIWYFFKDVTDNYVDHHMVDGIPIISLESKYKDKVDKIKINFSITSQNPSNQKYAIFSERPINTYKYDENVENVTYYCPVSKVNGVANTTRKIEIEEGDNEIEISKLQGGNVIYMKILWDDHVTFSGTNITYGEQYVTLDAAPKFVVTEKSS